MLVKKAFQKERAINGLVFVNNGEELLQYLRHEDPFATARWPDIVLLDLNMPKMDGREALKKSQSDPELRSIPIVVLTS